MRKVKFALLFIGCLLMLDGHSIHARGDEPAKPKKFANAWVPDAKPLRGILHFDGRQAGNPKPWQPFCERHGLVWFPFGRDGDVALMDEKFRAEVAAELNHPELVNAPVIRVGLSSNGGFQTPSLPDARPRSDRFRCGGRESNFLAATAVKKFVSGK